LQGLYLELFFVANHPDDGTRHTLAQVRREPQRLDALKNMLNHLGRWVGLEYDNHYSLLVVRLLVAYRHDSEA
jgi:hypothetical protein